MGHWCYSLHLYMDSSNKDRIGSFRIDFPFNFGWLIRAWLALYAIIDCKVRVWFNEFLFDPGYFFFCSPLFGLVFPFHFFLYFLTRRASRQSETRCSIWFVIRELLNEWLAELSFYLFDCYAVYFVLPSSPFQMIRIAAFKKLNNKLLVTRIMRLLPYRVREAEEMRTDWSAEALRIVNIGYWIPGIG